MVNYYFDLKSLQLKYPRSTISTVLVESFKSKTIFTTQDINENWQQVQITFKNHWGKMDPETYLIL